MCAWLSGPGPPAIWRALLARFFGQADIMSASFRIGHDEIGFLAAGMGDDSHDDGQAGSG